MLLLIVLAILAGLLLPVQAGVNAQLRAVLGDPIVTALLSFVVGTAALAGLVLGLRLPVPVGAALGRAVWWHWTGGLLGAIYIAVTVVLAPRLGAATFVAAIVAGQMLTSLVLDQFGLVGFPQHPVSPLRLLGATLIIAGVMLVRR